MAEVVQPDTGEDDSLAQLAVAARSTSMSRPLQPIGLGRRGAAFFIDAAVVMAPAAVVAADAERAMRRPGTLDWLLLLPVVALIGGYTIFEVKGGRSLGRLVTNSRAVRCDGCPASLGQRLLRAGLRNLPLIVAGGWTLCAAYVDLIADPVLRQWFRGTAAAYADRSVLGATLFVLVSGLCAVLPPHRALHDQIAGMAVYDESDLGLRRRTADAASGGFDVIVNAT